MTTMPTVKLIADIIQTSLGLTDDQIWIYNQRREIPPGKGLFVVVGNMGIVPYGVNNRPVAVDGGIVESLSQSFQETLSINLYSNDTSALTRVSEVIGALNSTYSQQIQTSSGFKIGFVATSVADTSFLEGTSQLYRFTVTLRVLRSYNSTSSIDYYDTFQTKAYTEEGEQ